MAHRVHHTVHITSESDDPHDDAVFKDPAFLAMCQGMVQAMSSYIAASKGTSAPKISMQIGAPRHEHD